MYAIVEDSGTQIKVSTGDILEVDLRDVEGDTITLDNVLMIGGEGEPTLGKSKAIKLTSLSSRDAKATAVKQVTVNVT